MAFSFNIKRKINRLWSRGNVVRDGRRFALDVFAFIVKRNEHVFRASFGMTTALVVGVRIVVMLITEFKEMNGL